MLYSFPLLFSLFPPLRFSCLHTFIIFSFTLIRFEHLSSPFFTFFYNSLIWCYSSLSTRNASVIYRYAESMKEKKSSPGKKSVLKSTDNDFSTTQKHGNAVNKMDISGNKKSSSVNALDAPIRAPLFPTQAQYRLPLTMTLSPQPADLLGNPPLSAALVSTYVHECMRTYVRAYLRACVHAFVDVLVYVIACMRIFFRAFMCVYVHV
jgi:hypothetical protein